MNEAPTRWGSEHFIGGHPALDLANTVFDRHTPADDNELLKSVLDLANWFRAMGLADDRQMRQIAEHADAELLGVVHRTREASFTIFDAIASGRDPAPEPLGLVMSAAAAGLRAGVVAVPGAQPSTDNDWREPRAVSSYIALLAVDAYFRLPREKIRSCPRCGWLFVDTSRGGQRRWCSMRTCGNREKASRHRTPPSTA